MTEPDPQVVDIVFDVEGTSLPADNAWPLSQAIERRLPWLADEALAGIHPLRAAPTTYGVVLLAQRAKLVLRAPEARLSDCLALQEAELDVAGSRLFVGAGKPRPLRPSATLSAQRVASDADDAQAFESEVPRLLAALAIECEFISGRRRQAAAGGREIAGFALALHGLSAADSLRVQGFGIGGERRLGWGVFVPAKSITAVGA
jgi:CRISPR-associated protein Cas6